MGETACVGAGDIWEISVPLSQFCCKAKTALGKVSNKKKLYSLFIKLYYCVNVSLLVMFALIKYFVKFLFLIFNRASIGRFNPYKPMVFVVLIKACDRVLS